ncbi:hypothetical protein OO013_07220 [Mangrovivirga sp. M17]|uniref:Lamin tail domain-containing protein n=1 Tax=Mangrovivirga halotolerans TaxID=2993936 RepID=A0ABT3RPC4_9BACT|nr:hypothetical protein [Mangrovivirga halotolerans]MCX2743648.1 hypothetical protein [Mangrovivirga halotolerans]
MGKINFTVLSILLLICCDVEPHDADDYEFRILNSTDSEVLFKSFNIGEESGYIEIKVNESLFISGGGILRVDSVRFKIENPLDSITFVNNYHGGDLNDVNHFFNYSNWKEKNINKYYYILTKEDFER